MCYGRFSVLSQVKFQSQIEFSSLGKSTFYTQYQVGPSKNWLVKIIPFSTKTIFSTTESVKHSGCSEGRFLELQVQHSHWHGCVTVLWLILSAETDSLHYTRGPCQKIVIGRMSLCQCWSSCRSSRVIWITWWIRKVEVGQELVQDLLSFKFEPKAHCLTMILIYLETLWSLFTWHNPG